MRAHFVLYVHDQRAAADFYAKTLAIESRLDVPGMTEFALGDGAVLGLMPETSATRLLGRKIDTSKLALNPCAEIYLLVDDPVDFHARALAAGAIEISPLAIRDWGHETAYSLDISGHVLAFAREFLKNGGIYT